jgi:serine/threonine protein phosphatase PrpC
MELTEHLDIGDARLFVGRDMDNGAFFEAGPGVGAVYSSPSPGKATPNEDAAAFFSFGERDCVLAVADGLGGAPAGDQASHLAMEAMWTALVRGIEKESEPREAILNGFEDANHAVLELGIGAATTLAVVEVRGNIVRPYHVGDSLILIAGQRGKVKLQSVPHSPVGYGIESGLLDEKEAMYHEERHIVSNVIGSPDMRIEIGSTIKLAARDTLVLASDGLWDNLHTEEIVDRVRKGPLRRAVRAVSEECGLRMRDGGEGKPSKPDDLTFILFRLYPPRRSKVG